MALASLKSLGTEPLTQNCCINSVSLTVMTSPPSLKIFGGISSATGAFPAWSCLFFSGFPSVLGDRQESLEPGAEAYLGWLTGRSVEKLAKDFTPTLNDIRLSCKQGSIRRWDRSHGIGRGTIYSLQALEEPLKVVLVWVLLQLCSLVSPPLILRLSQLSLDFFSEALEAIVPGSWGLFLKPIGKCFLLLLQKACVFCVVGFKQVLLFSLFLFKW